ncbi:hypothetical protein [Burkholderia pseudomallei]|nr:hypothetical protein [Burkholderia pseudomallei]
MIELVCSLRRAVHAGGLPARDTVELFIARREVVGGVGRSRAGKSVTI